MLKKKNVEKLIENDVKFNTCDEWSKIHLLPDYSIPNQIPHINIKLLSFLKSFKSHI
jgi:hypothetical protein